MLKALLQGEELFLHVPHYICIPQRVLESIELLKHCYALNYKPKKNHVEVLTPNTYECDLIWK